MAEYGIGRDDGEVVQRGFASREEASDILCRLYDPSEYRVVPILTVVERDKVVEKLEELREPRPRRTLPAYRPSLVDGCPRDTNGDGDCGRSLCPHCGTDPQLVAHVRKVGAQAIEEHWGYRIARADHAVDCLRAWGDEADPRPIPVDIVIGWITGERPDG